MLDVALLAAALATIASALPGLMHGGELLLAAIGELMLCVIASALAIYGRGYLVKAELPRPTRPEPVIIGAGAPKRSLRHFCSRKPSTASV